MAKRDNPRLKQREEDKQQKREKYFKGKEAREEKALSAKTGQKEKKTDRRLSYYEPKEGRDGGRAERSPRDIKEGKVFREVRDGRDGKEEREENPNLIMGRNPVMEAVKSGRTIDKILMQKDGEGSIRKIASLAHEKGLQIQYVEKMVLDRLTCSRSHQGIAAFVSAYDYCEIEDILEIAKNKGEDPFIILLDGLEDPHNLGAIMRTADAVGAHGIIIPNRRTVGLTETVAKASAGAIEYIPVAKVANIVAAMGKLKAAGLWIGACDMGGQQYSDAKLKGPLGIVIGGEGQGVSRLVRESSDFVLTIPMVGKISSLNASNAAAVLMYEVFRQRMRKSEK